MRKPPQRRRIPADYFDALNEPYPSLFRLNPRYNLVIPAVSRDLPLEADEALPTYGGMTSH